MLLDYFGGVLLFGSIILVSKWVDVCGIWGIGNDENVCVSAKGRRDFA